MSDPEIMRLYNEDYCSAETISRRLNISVGRVNRAVRSARDRGERVRGRIPTHADLNRGIRI